MRHHQPPEVFSLIDVRVAGKDESPHTHFAIVFDLALQTNPKTGRTRLRLADLTEPHRLISTVEASGDGTAILYPDADPPTTTSILADLGASATFAGQATELRFIPLTSAAVFLHVAYRFQALLQSQAGAFLWQHEYQAMLVRDQHGFNLARNSGLDSLFHQEPISGLHRLARGRALGLPDLIG